MTLKIGILGFGKMGSAIASGLLEKKFDAQIHALDKSAVLPSNITPAKNELELLENSDVLIICVKPQDVANLLDNLKNSFRSLKSVPIFVSIAAGITLELLGKKIGKSQKIVRVMPNIAATVGQAASAIAANGNCKRGDVDLILKIFRCIGKAYVVSEEEIDIVTATSGSGPAYFFLLTEKLTEAAQKAGLEKSLAQKLAIQTIIGSAKMLEKTGEAPKDLREKVTSPNGTTAAALKVFEERDFGIIVSDALNAAKKRAKELSKG
ncbi:pyrroline-5-carboxylate reductase [Candidatus Micrarchaeota archaeon]|nr:pyrroline-5-carboxylate reductase [Candidatus Micrarchaeota archaeon]